MRGQRDADDSSPSPHHDDEAHLFCQGDEQTLVANMVGVGDQGNFNVTIARKSVYSC